MIVMEKSEIGINDDLLMHLYLGGLAAKIQSLCNDGAFNDEALIKYNEAKEKFSEVHEGIFEKAFIHAIVGVISAKMLGISDKESQNLCDEIRDYLSEGELPIMINVISKMLDQKFRNISRGEALKLLKMNYGGKEYMPVNEFSRARRDCQARVFGLDWQRYSKELRKFGLWQEEESGCLLPFRDYVAKEVYFSK